MRDRIILKGPGGGGEMSGTNSDVSIAEVNALLDAVAVIRTGLRSEHYPAIIADVLAAGWVPARRLEAQRAEILEAAGADDVSAASAGDAVGALVMERDNLRRRVDELVVEGDDMHEKLAAFRGMQTERDEAKAQLDELAALVNSTNAAERESAGAAKAEGLDHAQVLLAERAEAMAAAAHAAKLTAEVDRLEAALQVARDEAMDAMQEATRESSEALTALAFAKRTTAARETECVMWAQRHAGLLRRLSCHPGAANG